MNTSQALCFLLIHFCISPISLHQGGHAPEVHLLISCRPENTNRKIQGRAWHFEKLRYIVSIEIIFKVENDEK